VNTQTYATEFYDTNDSFLSAQEGRVNVNVASCYHGGGKANLIFFGRHFEYDVGGR